MTKINNPMGPLPSPRPEGDRTHQKGPSGRTTQTGDTSEKKKAGRTQEASSSSPASEVHEAAEVERTSERNKDQYDLEGSGSEASSGKPKLQGSSARSAPPARSAPLENLLRPKGKSVKTVASPSKAEDKTPAAMVELAQRIYPAYSRELEPAKQQIASVFEGLGSVQGRAKDPVSSANRLQRAVERFGATVTNPEQALDNLWDAIGTRLVLSDASPKAMDQVVDRMASAIREGKLDIFELNNLHGPGGKPYFTPEHIQTLRQAAAEAGKSLRVNASKNMETGYTVVCAYINHDHDVKGELQLIGPRTLELANAEHIPYDVSLGKPLVRNVASAAEPKIRELVAPVEKAMEGMSKAEMADYNQYLNQSYIHARNQELGMPSTPPGLPTGLSEVLSTENIQRVERELARIKAQYKS